MNMMVSMLYILFWMITLIYHGNRTEKSPILSVII